ncbi:MAG TPA: hypothetical protein VKU61_10305 [Candidatus Binatia bacterium]|nr:hypothetical protein [Candidatus Binatia bacterium]
MNWYKVKTKEERDSYTYVGASTETAEVIAERAARGEYIRLDELLYMDRGDIKEWAEWDKSLVPTVYINPANILSFVQFKGDPRVVSRK